MTRRLKLSMPIPTDGSPDPPLQSYVEHANSEDLVPVKIAITGKYATLKDSYISIVNALEHSAVALGVRVEPVWVDTTEIRRPEDLERFLPQDTGGVIVPGGFGARGVEGKIQVIGYARERGIPFLGICYGFHFAVVEFARHVCDLEGAQTTEVNSRTPHPVIHLLPEQRKKSKLGGTMRLGGHKVRLDAESMVAKLYGRTEVTERFRHRFEFNNDYRKVFEKGGMRFVGTTPDGEIMQVLVLPDHPYFVACQFHPEYTSRPLAPNPIFYGLVQAAIKKRELALV